MSDEQDVDEYQKVGPYLLKKLKPGPTTAEFEPTYAPCTPDRWGMRFSDIDPQRRGRLMYPVARDYAKAIHDLLINKIKWGNAYFGSGIAEPVLMLTWPIDREQFNKFFDLIKPIIGAPLASHADGFGIPESAMPAIVSYTPSSSFEQGAFAPNSWEMRLNLGTLEDIFKVKEVAPTAGGRESQTQKLESFADTLYHESRHCQQSFWIFALITQHPENFEKISEISNFPALITSPTMGGTRISRIALDLASKAALPDDTSAFISLKRMAVGQYCQNLYTWIKGGYWPPYLESLDAAKDHYMKVRAAAIDLLQNVGLGGTPIDVDAMVEVKKGCTWDYSGRPWENDAFFCGDMATAYWKPFFGLNLYTHATDQCSHAYELAYMHKPANSTNNGEGNGK
ncbi:hypothetical protein [Paraburkholderia sp. J67]|uniref:hypothetical protein n=1 Tax=Paraburkholderia sp. J67 TaxID=2805435 RepID=UPI002ABDABCB|nr:hypothetical protein [Paraburkholderia sp. J67]